MKKITLLPFLLLFLTSTASAVTSKTINTQPIDPAKKKQLKAKLATVQIPFIKNEIQMDSRVKYYANIFSGTVFITDEGITYALQGNNVENEKGWVIKENLLNAKKTKAEGVKTSETKVNYFIGKDRNKWR